MSIKTKRRWLWLVTALLLCFGAAQTGSAWDMIPPAESVRKASDEFNQVWRLEAGRKFDERRTLGTNAAASYILILSLVVMLGVLFHFMVKLNHMERALRRVRADMLCICTRMWLISRWGFRY